MFAQKRIRRAGSCDLLLRNERRLLLVRHAYPHAGAAAVPAVGLTGSKRRTAGGEHVYAAQAECVDWNAKWAAEPRPLGEVYGPEVAALVAERASPPQREAAWEHWCAADPLCAAQRSVACTTACRTGDTP